MQTERGHQTYDQRNKSLQEKLCLNLQLCHCCACAVTTDTHAANHKDMWAVNSSFTFPLYYIIFW